MKINERMKEARKQKDLNQEEIAIKLEMTRQQYGLYETGKREMPPSKLREFCKICEVSADWILDLPKGLPYPD